MGLITRKAKVVLGYQEGKPTVYKVQQIRYPQVTTDQLVNECSVSCGVNESQTKAVIDALLNRMCHYIEIGHPVKMGEFGSFNPVINVKCVKTEEEATSETIQKKRIQFIPGKRLRQTMADLTIKTAGDALND